MTPVEQKIHARLKDVKPTDFKDEAFINQLDKWKGKSMTSKGHDHMLTLMKKYRKEIPDWFELQRAIIDEDIAGLGSTED